MSRYHKLGDNMNKEEETIDNKEITKRLDTLIAILLDKDEIRKQTDTQKIKFLTKLEFSNPEIASILNTTVQSVESQKYRKKGKKQNE